MALSGSIQTLKTLPVWKWKRLIINPHIRISWKNISCQGATASPTHDIILCCFGFPDDFWDHPRVTTSPASSEYPLRLPRSPTTFEVTDEFRIFPASSEFPCLQAVNEEKLLVSADRPFFLKKLNFLRLFWIVQKLWSRLVVIWSEFVRSFRFTDNSNLSRIADGRFSKAND